MKEINKKNEIDFKPQHTAGMSVGLRQQGQS